MWFTIALKFDRCLGSSAAEAPVKFQCNMLPSNLEAMKLGEILQTAFYHLVNWIPENKLADKVIGVPTFIYYHLSAQFKVIRVPTFI